MDEHLLDEATYDRQRLAQWQTGDARGEGISRRSLMRLSAALGVGAAVPGLAGLAGPAVASAAEVDPNAPIVKPLPPELFTVFGTNAEMRWSAMRDQGYLVPIDRFFVRNHTRTPLIDADTWRLRLYGNGLRGRPTADAPYELTYRQLRRLPSETFTAAVECAGNGRSFYTTQQGQTVSGTAWRLGAVGVARWRGVRLSTVLQRAGLTRSAVDVLPIGLDPNFVSGGVDLGPVRRPLPVRKAIQDVLLAYEMNGEPLPADHGHPVRLIVPEWIGISSIKWVGAIEVADEPLFSPWNTQFYRLFGPDYPADGELINRQVAKSAFELDWDSTLPAGRRTTLQGRSWSPGARIARVEVSTDGGQRWKRARLTHARPDAAWQRWTIDWRPERPGTYQLLARATDSRGVTQPDVNPYNTLGYLFGAVVRHPVTVN